MTQKVQIMLNRMDRAVEHWFLPIIGKQKGRLMVKLVKSQQPKSAVEVGALIGYSTIIIAANLPPRGRLTSLEVSPFLAFITERNVAEAGLKNRVRVISQDACKALKTMKGPIDFLFIDATKEDYLAYLRAAEPRLLRGALVVADNTKMFKSEMLDYLRHVRKAGRYTSREYDFGFDAMEVSRFIG